jgi:hypothetical protein
MELEKGWGFSWISILVQSVMRLITHESGILPTKAAANAQTHLPPEAAARHERRLEAVRCSAVFGWGTPLAAGGMPPTPRRHLLPVLSAAHVTPSRRSSAPV